MVVWVGGRGKGWRRATSWPERRRRAAEQAAGGESKVVGACVSHGLTAHTSLEKASARCFRSGYIHFAKEKKMGIHPVVRKGPM